MRTGANFARGSCRALKWMLVLGALSVMGSDQAVAQAPPTIETATYDADSRNVVVTTSQDVFVDGETDALLPGDFELSGGGIAAGSPKSPFAVRLLAGDANGAVDEFILVFDTDIDTLAIPDPDVENPIGPLLLKYTPDPIRPILSEAGTAMSVQENVLVVGPKEDSDLTLRFDPPSERTRVEKVRKRGTPYSEDLPEATGVTLAQLTAVTYAATAAPVGLLLGAPPSEGVPGLYFTPAVDMRTLAGTLPDVVGSWVVTYTATLAVDDIPRASLTFKVNVADVPDVTAKPDVVAAGPSSLKVTWVPPNGNNSAITSYELQYKAATASSN